MTGKQSNKWMVALLAFATACTTARADSNEAAPGRSEMICRDKQVETLWDRKEKGCRAHFDACLPTLTPEQRATWEQQIATCIETKSVYDCYAAAPWC